jgi:hypothetical protein
LKVILRARNRLIGGRSAACFFTQSAVKVKTQF